VHRNLLEANQTATVTDSIGAPSWGTLLQDAQDLTVLANYPWLLWPCAFVMLAVILFNFVGDGLRDAADPYA
jgi:peptide/nickel transport system permease protein